MNIVKTFFEHLITTTKIFLVAALVLAIMSAPITCALVTDNPWWLLGYVPELILFIALLKTAEDLEDLKYS